MSKCIQHALGMQCLNQRKDFRIPGEQGSSRNAVFRGIVIYAGFNQGSYKDLWSITNMGPYLSSLSLFLSQWLIVLGFTTLQRKHVGPCSYHM